MKINTDNYEAFLLDAIEGRLSPEQQATLLVFLSEHPELDADFDLPEFIAPTAAPLESGGFSALKIPSAFTSKDLWLAAVAEGDLNDDFTRAARADATHSAEIARLQRLKLVPDTSVVFDGKARLRRGGTVVQLGLVYRMAAVAAVLFGLFLGGWWMLRNDAPARIARFEPRDLEIRRDAVPADTSKPSNEPAAFGAENAAHPSGEGIKNVPPSDRLMAENSGSNSRMDAPKPATPRPAMALAVNLPERNPIAAPEMHGSADSVDQESFASNETHELPSANAPQQTRPLTVTEFLAREAQTRIKGDVPAPDESLSATLATAAQSTVENLSKGQVRFNRKDDRSFFLKVGQLSIER